MLRLKTFGGLWLEGDEGPLTGAATQRRRLVLLAALAAAGQRGMSRDAVVGLLWPEVDGTRARAALSQSLYALKRDTGVDELVLGGRSPTRFSRGRGAEWARCRSRSRFSSAPNEPSTT